MKRWRWPILPRSVVALVLLGLIGSGAWSLSHLTIEKDVTRLLPRGESDASALQIARDAGLMKRVVVLIGPDRASSERLHGAIDAVAAVLRKLDGVTSVTGPPAPADAARAVRIALDHGAALNLPGRSPPLTPGAAAAKLAALKERLASPEAIATAPYLLADPLGWSGPALAGMEAMGKAMGTAVERGHLLSADRRFGIVAVRIAFDPFDVERSGRFALQLDRSIRRALDRAGFADLGAIALGGVYFAASSGSAIMRDIGASIALALSGIAVVAVILMLLFRRIRLLAVSFLPGALGILSGVAVLALFQGRIHAVTLGFSATITGVSVDYAIHLLYRAAYNRRLLANPPRLAMESALAEVGGGIALSCAATVGSFAIVATSGFAGVRELAVLSGISVLVAMLGTLLLLPPFHRFLLSEKTVEPPTGYERRLIGALEGYAPRGALRLSIIGLFGALFVLAALFAFRARGSGDPNDLSYRDPELEQRRARIASVIPGFIDQAMLVARGESAEGALEVNDALYEALRQGGVPASAIVSVSPFLPSASNQRRALAESRRVLRLPEIRGAFLAAGFREAFYGDLLKAADSAPLAPSSYRGTGLDAAVGEALHDTGSGSFVLTRVAAAGDPEVERLQAIAGRVPGARLLSERLEAERALVALQNELVYMMLLWFGLSFALLFASRRSVAFAARALVAPALGLLCAMGLFGLLGRPLTPVAVASATMILGFGVDFGIFMQPKHRGEFSAAALSVIASALTTIAGFSALIWARVGALSDMGLSITVGTAVAFLSAIVLVPALSRGPGDPGKSEPGADR